MFKALFTNSDGTPNWLGCIAVLLAIVILPGLLVGWLTNLWVGIAVSVVILVLILAALFWISSALNGLS